MRLKKRSEVGLMSKKTISRRTQTMKKKASQKAVMPPPVLDVSDTWRPGDVVEVFDKVSWKMAVLSQVLGKKCFLVRPIGSSSEFKVGKANIRERISWTHDTCDAIEKDFCNWTDGECNGSSNIKYDEKRLSQQISTNFGPNDADSFACSVGSCSIASNYMNEFPLRPSSDQIDGNFSNAESVLHMEDKKQKENMYIPAKEELEAEIHKLELHAYRCTMEALHASGPLSWEKEELDMIKTCLEPREEAEDYHLGSTTVESIRNSCGEVRLDSKDDNGSTRSSKSA